jgi:uncharacterized protein YecT (DUF1311 family)
MKFSSIQFILFITFFAFSKGSVDSTDCYFPKIDEELNKTYNKVLNEYKSDTLFIRRIKEAQRAWIKFRDAHLESRFPSTSNTNQYNEYGSIYPYCACVIMTELTKERIKQLQAWLNGTIEGDVCGGSYKTSK